MNRYLAVGLSVVAGAAVIEAALIPGIVIGGAAVLAPKYLSGLRRRLSSAPRKTVDAQRATTGSQKSRSATEPLPIRGRFAIRQALVKTVTFRIIVTSLDFTTNYIVIGELATAAGLSSFALVAGPVFYFLHETAWNYYHDSAGNPVTVHVLPSTWRQAGAAPRGFTVSRALAKTVTFRTFATAMDFGMTYVVVGDAVIAAGLSAVGFVVGPFVYIWHEMAWDHFARAKGAAIVSTSPTDDHAQVGTPRRLLALAR